MNADHSIAALMNPGEAENFFAIDGLLPFDPTPAAGFDRNIALWLAEFSRLIYRRERDEQPDRPPGFRTRDQILAEHGWREQSVFRTNQGVPQAALFGRSDRDAWALVFRGTLGLPDMITDVRWVLRPWEGEGHVHEGFKQALEPLWPAVRARLRDLRGPVFLTGHSLGGALATMTAALCRRALPTLSIGALYSFGSPRVGDHAFAGSIDGVTHFRVVNDLDVIPRLPPAIPNRLLPFFEHNGQLQHLVDGCRRAYPATVDPFVADTGLPTAIELQRALVNGRNAIGKPPPFLTDHAPVNYVARLERFAD